MKKMFPKEIVKFIKKNFNDDEMIMLHSESCRTHEDGWAFDTAWCLCRELMSEDMMYHPDEKFYYTVGKCLLYYGTDAT